MLLRGTLLLVALLLALPAQAQQQVRPCITTVTANVPGCTAVSATNPLPVTGTVTASSAATATASAPSYSEGTSNALSQNLTGDLRVIAKQSTSPWIAAGGGTAGTAATGVLTVQGIASMTPLLATVSGTITGITNTVVTQELGASFVNITTNADTNVKASAGTIVGFSTNSIGTGSTLKLFNDADGTCSSALIDTFSTVLQNYVAVPVAATIGICAQTAGAGAADITVYFR